MAQSRKDHLFIHGRIFCQSRGRHIGGVMAYELKKLLEQPRDGWCKRCAGEVDRLVRLRKARENQANEVRVMATAYGGRGPTANRLGIPCGRCGNIPGAGCYCANQTPGNARDRVLKARLGSLAGEPTEEYLKELIHAIGEWEASVRGKLAGVQITNERLKNAV